eukprot:TRINITY_DN31510_c0_g2_i1.p1 TRINITY_DN31510_c0_g2~~TRINITY_DN31510_c0_g2_i1.p1  ORF type:complete len:431 (+),score=47.27 TRINITY_DN31510_c0_g2_i1:39-1295(+)
MGAAPSWQCGASGALHFAVWALVSVTATSVIDSGATYVRFSRGVDVENDNALDDETVTDDWKATGLELFFGHVSRHVSLVFLVVNLIIGVVARRRKWLSPSAGDLLRQATFKFFFAAFLLYHMWKAPFDSGLVNILFFSLVTHSLWFVLSLFFATVAPQPEARCAPSSACIAGWMMLMTQGQNLSFTYGVISESPALSERGLACAVMWDLGGNIWLCQGIMWGIATYFSPAIEAGSEDAEGFELNSAVAREKQKPRGRETVDRVVRASLECPLLHSCILGVTLNCLDVPLSGLMSSALFVTGGPFKALSYFIVGFYWESDINKDDMRLIGIAIIKRSIIQLAIAFCVYFFLPLSDLLDRRAILIAVLSPVNSTVMHILAESSYGDHLVKLSVMGGAIDVIRCTLIQHALIAFVFSEGS